MLHLIFLVVLHTNNNMQHKECIWEINCLRTFCISFIKYFIAQQSFLWASCSFLFSCIHLRTSGVKEL